VRLHIRSAAVPVKLMATKEDLADLKHDLKRDIASLRAQVNSSKRKSAA
jgi:hypothetical protein